MTVEDIRRMVDAELVCGEDLGAKEAGTIYATDLMSSVLAQEQEISVLVTGLGNAQVIRTAEMLDMVCVVIVRGVCPCDELIEAAKDSGIVVLATKKSMFDTCGILYEEGKGRGVSNGK
ncbi:MAG: hypothetical protein E7242_07670 [Lachnospiraceae bacterium]|nr:hypothetical protein [Lachnospiraceae bacterium]MCR5082518.1 hypothetical protein [Parasporobacterium sp.]